MVALGPHTCSAFIRPRYRIYPEDRSRQDSCFKSKNRSAEHSRSQHIVQRPQDAVLSPEKPMSPPATAESTATSIEDRMEARSWPEVADHLDRYGWAMVEKIL